MQKSLRDEIKYLENILIEKPKSILFARLADCYMQMGRLDEAIELCEHGIRLHPTYISGHFVLGKCYVRKKLFDLAEKELRRVVVLDPKYIAAYRELGELTAQNGWQNACETNFEEILRIDPLNERAKQRFAMLKQQFAINEQMQKSGEDSSFQTPKPDDFAARESAKPEIDDTHFDLVEAEPEQPPIETKPEPPSPVFDESDEKELNLLEDIFSDDSVTDLDAEPSFQLAEEQKPSPKETTPSEQPISEPELETPEPENPPREQPTERPRPLPGSEELQAEYDPFYQLEKQKEKESAEIEDSLFPFDSEQREIKKPAPEPQQPPFEPETAKQEPVREEKPPVKEPGPKRPSPLKDSLATPTLGEIYAAQRQYGKAIGVYEQLLKKDPGNEMYNQKIAMLQKKMEEEANQ